MRSEIITLKDAQVIGIAKEIAFCKTESRCHSYLTWRFPKQSI